MQRLWTSKATFVFSKSIDNVRKIGFHIFASLPQGTDYMVGSTGGSERSRGKKRQALGGHTSAAAGGRRKSPRLVDRSWAADLRAPRLAGKHQLAPDDRICQSSRIDKLHRHAWMRDPLAFSRHAWLLAYIISQSTLDHKVLGSTCEWDVLESGFLIVRHTL